MLLITIIIILDYFTRWMVQEHLLIYCLMIVFILLHYLLTSIAIRRMSINMGLDYPWLSWIPFIRLYQYGEICLERVTITDVPFRGVQVILPLGMLLFNFIIGIPIVAPIYFIAFALYRSLVSLRIYKLYALRHAYWLLTITLFTVGLAEPFIIFALRKRERQEYLTYFF